jgi:hypothetical protein
MIKPPIFYMARFLITSLALCLLFLSAGKSYASAELPLVNGNHDVMSTHTSNETMAQGCDDIGSGGADLFSHFNCHLNMTSLITNYSSIGLMDLPSPNYIYQFSSNVHIQALSTKPPLFA